MSKIRAEAPIGHSASYPVAIDAGGCFKYPLSRGNNITCDCRLALLSNTDPLHSAHLESHFAFMKHFPVRVYSCRVGASKPSPAIYAAALDTLGLPPSEALYIDDIAEYAAAAQGLGLDAIRFESPTQLLAQLSERRLLEATG